MGITRIANVTGLDRIGIPVVVVSRPNARSLAVAQGKGLTLAAAQASAVMESIELYHAEYIHLPLKLGTPRELSPSHRLVNLDALPQLKRSRFHHDRTMLWIEGRDLITDTSRWVPYELVHTRYILPFPTGSGCFHASSNGLASGNHLVEAINHGIAEVVERDSTALWNRGDRALRRVDLATVDDPDCASVIDQIERAGLTVGVWDTTSDVGIASFYSLVVDQRYEMAHSGSGSGAHPSRAVAFLRAVTEAVQVRTTYISGSRDDLEQREFAPEVIVGRTRQALKLLSTSERCLGRSFQDIPTNDGPTCADDLAWMTNRLRTVGIEELVVVDLTRRETFDIPVVRVVIPGLEGPDDHDRYVPGPRALRLGEAQ
jgi:ribosomal protein S12 methylthiotransferase accessory factor